MRAAFNELRARGRKGLIPYICAGDPSRASTVPLMHALARAGADVIELGVPFSDPMADGPVIQRAAERAIRNGVGLKDTIAMVAEFRRSDTATPVVLMGYANPIERMGRAEFARAAQAAGVDGVLVVDYPPEEAAESSAQLKAAGIDPIFLRDAYDDRRANRGDRGAGGGLSVLRQPERHHRCRASRRGCRCVAVARDPPLYRPAGGSGLWHP